MKDREIFQEIDQLLTTVSDTEILLNFSKGIMALYPYLVKIQAHSYDSWDEIVEDLFFKMVYKTFAFKYGVTVSIDKCLRYESHFSNISGHIHIECIPKTLPVQAVSLDQVYEINNKLIKGKKLVLISFGDGKHFLTGGYNAEDVKEMNFNYTEIQLVDRSTGLLTDRNLPSIFVPNEQLEYKFVP